MIRPTRPDDTDAIIALWHAAWHEAHGHLVPPEMLPLRTPAHFALWWRDDPAAHWVAEESGTVTGFVSINGDELSRLFVAPAARGTGTAAALLRHGENRLAETGITRAHLLCLAGNDRAERFYAREGWQTVQTLDCPLWYPPGVDGGVTLSTHRMEKALRRGPG